MLGTSGDNCYSLVMVYIARHYALGLIYAFTEIYKWFTSNLQRAFVDYLSHLGRGLYNVVYNLCPVPLSFCNKICLI